MKYKAVFLDRDGVICRDVHYRNRIEDFELLPTVPQAIKLLNNPNYLTILITNQSGITRGHLTHKILSDIHKKMKDELAGFNARIDNIRYCSHHQDEKCNCRKPGTVLLDRVIQEHSIDVKVSFMVGDTLKDIDAAKAVGCRTILVMTGPGHKREIVCKADYTASNLLDAVNWILKH